MTRPRYFDRDLSWLSFNYRVLMEAKNPEVPLYDRIKFLGIFSSNLDEFFRVRVAALKSLSAINKYKIRKKLNLEPEVLLAQIMKIVDRHQQEFGNIYQKSIIPALRKNKIVLYQDQMLTKSQQKFVSDYFFSRVLSYLQPVLIYTGNEYFLNNRQLYFIIELSSLQDGKCSEIAFLNLPSDALPRFVELPGSRGRHFYMYLDDIIRANLNHIFPGYVVKGCYSVKLNRDADLHIDDEFEGNLVEKIKKNLSKRMVGTPSRFLYDQAMPEVLLEKIIKAFDIDRQDVVKGGRFHNMHDLMKLPNPFHPALESEKLLPLPNVKIDAHDSIFSAIDQADQMLHFPYHSYDYVLRFFNEAAIHPNVKEIKVTLYRIATQSFIANALISAARNGKKVCVFLEVKARFDEENNLRWAQEMQEAGIKILYSIPGLKVHAKVAYIRMKKDGKNQEYGYFGTGNFNEVTADIYADHALLTARQDVLKELKAVFRFLEEGKAIPPLQHLLVAQSNMIGVFLELIDFEIAAAKAGKAAGITIKLNNLEEHTMIDKLYEASRAGVPVNLIIRGICCLVPGVKGLSENIRVIRIVDRFLEHARIFIFHHDGDELIYLASADWMKRNLYHRIEVGFPLYHETIRHEIKKFIQLQLQDNRKSCYLDSKMNNKPVKDSSGKRVRAQEDFYAWLKKHT